MKITSVQKQTNEGAERGGMPLRNLYSLLGKVKGFKFEAF